jgi:nucleotide-binding universal stress UspA family protein
MTSPGGISAGTTTVDIQIDVNPFLGRTREGDMDTIVVGLDTSPSSRAALHWAAEQARLTGRRVLAINAIPVPPSLAAAGIIGVPDSVVSMDDLDVPYRESMASVWESVSPEPSWSLEFVFEDAGPALVRRSADAVLVVVGTHEHTGLARLVSGSASRYCLRHSHCPTVIVPAGSVALPRDESAPQVSEEHAETATEG